MFEIFDVERREKFEGAPVSQKRIRRPTPQRFNNIGGYAAQ
jgi:hypothetical protein